MGFCVLDNVVGLSGYAKAVRELGYEINRVIPTRFVGNRGHLGYLPEKIYPLLSNFGPTDYDFVLWRPYFNPFPKEGKLIANIALESTVIPERMVKEANDDRVRQVWCPSKFCFENYAASGILEDKLRIVPHGYNPNIFKIVKTPINKLFRFLFVGGYTGPNDRKGADLLINSFVEEFPEGEAELYLKINTTYGLGNLPRRSDIIIDVDAYTDKQMVDIYNRGDCYVLPTQGEAFDMSILEATACGLPIITNWNGGQVDYLDDLVNCDDSRVYYLDSEEAIPRFSPWDCGKWYKPTKESLKSAMRDMFEWRDKNKKYKGIENWTWEKAAQKAIKYIKELE